MRDETTYTFMATRNANENYAAAAFYEGDASRYSWTDEAICSVGFIWTALTVLAGRDTTEADELASNLAAIEVNPFGKTDEWSEELIALAAEFQVDPNAPQRMKVCLRDGVLEPVVTTQATVDLAAEFMPSAVYALLGHFIGRRDGETGNAQRRQVLTIFKVSGYEWQCAHDDAYDFINRVADKTHQIENRTEEMLRELLADDV